MSQGPIGPVPLDPAVPPTAVLPPPPPAAPPAGPAPPLAEPPFVVAVAPPEPVLPPAAVVPPELVVAPPAAEPPWPVAPPPLGIPPIPVTPPEAVLPPLATEPPWPVAPPLAVVPPEPVSPPDPAELPRSGAAQAPPRIESATTHVRIKLPHFMSSPCVKPRKQLVDEIPTPDKGATASRSGLRNDMGARGKPDQSRQTRSCRLGRHSRWYTTNDASRSCGSISTRSNQMPAPKILNNCVHDFFIG